MGTSAFAQKEEYEKAIDYCNCKLTFAYITKFTYGMPSDKMEKKSFDLIKDEFGKCEIGSAIQYSKLSILLNNNNFKYSNANFSKIIDATKGSYSDNLRRDVAVGKIIKGIFENNNLQGAINKYINADDMKVELSNEISNYFEGKFYDNDKIVTINGDGGSINRDELKTIISDEVSNRIQDVKYHPWKFNYWTVIFVISGIIIVYLIVRNDLKDLNESRLRHRNVIDRLTSQVENYSNIMKGDKTVDTFDDWKNNIEKDLFKATQKIIEFDNVLEKFKVENDHGRNSNNIYNNQQSIERQSKAETFYASIPSKSGHFNENAISNAINPTASFYKITVTDSFGQKANFEFLGNDERAVKDATNEPDRILRPACKINNALNQSAKKIKTINPGTVIKRDGKWEILTLAEIEYE